MSNNNEQVQQQEGGNKVEKKFEQNMSKLLAIFKGDKSVFKTKVPNSDVGELVEEILKERREEAKAQFKARASKLLDKKVEFDRFVKQKENELKDAIKKQMEEFNKEMESTFQLLENIDILAGEYAKSMKQMPGDDNQEGEV